MIEQHKTLWNIREDEIDSLLPGGTRGTLLVLFVDESSTTSTLQFSEAASHLSIRAGVAHAASVPRLAKWYGIDQFPAVAMISDGVLLALETDCSDSSCKRVLEWARGTLEGLARL